MAAVRRSHSAARSRRRAVLLLAAAGAFFGVTTLARADSAVGTGGVPGNQLNPTGLPPGIMIDPNGMSRLVDYSRSPTGLLYPKPFLQPEMTQGGENSAWWHSSWADIGFLTGLGRTGTASFIEYGDWSAGPVASFGFRAENRENANYFSGSAGSIGRDDQYYELQFGRHGLLDVDLFFDATPHVFATNAKILWNGAGTDNLTLPSGLVPGAATAAGVQAAYATTPLSKLSLTRNKTGMTATYTPFESWEVFLNLSSERREGTRAIGSAFSFPARGAAELVEPIEYTTIEMVTGVRFKGEATQANLAYAGSFFRNDNSALTWDNPGLGAPTSSYIPRQGRIALAPDNDYHTIKGDFAWILPDVRFVAHASYSAMLQNDALLPPTVNSGFTPVDLGNWNTVAALSQETADAEIETTDLFAQMLATPAADLRLTLETRYRNEDNKTSYLAYNPLTMQYGYMGLDGALSRIYTPAAAGSDVPIRNIPFATDRFEMSAKADYRLADRTRLNLSFAHKEADRMYREVSHSNDNVLEAQISSAGHNWGTIRVSYELAARSGSDYVADPYGFARSVSLPLYVPRSGGDPPYALRSLYKYDVGDRTEQAIKAQSNFILSEKTDLQLSGGYRSADYAPDYGLQALRTFDLNASLTTQLSAAMTFNALYGFQSRRRDVASINVVRAASSDDSAGGPNYPLGNAWSETADDANHVVGGSLHYGTTGISIDLSYMYSFANSEFSYAYAGPGAISSNLTAVQAGSAFPDQKFAQHVFETSVVWPYDEKITLRGYYRLEHEALDDFHYDGLTNVVANHLFLAAVPQDYTAHIIGLFSQWRF